MDFNKEIKSLGVTKQRIAKKIGISNVLLSYYLNGTRPMPEHIDLKLKELISMYQAIL
jgi:predicted transcriptional regulator